MKYQFENDLGILNYLSGTNEKSAIVLTQPEMETTNSSWKFYLQSTI
jgi:hypothetical protein